MKMIFFSLITVLFIITACNEEELPSSSRIIDILEVDSILHIYGDITRATDKKSYFIGLTEGNDHILIVRHEENLSIYVIDRPVNVWYKK